jgi:hypothetical protein
MKQSNEQNKLFKENLLKEIDFHLNRCTDNDCDVSLFVLYQLASIFSLDDSLKSAIK